METILNEYVEIFQITVWK